MYAYWRNQVIQFENYTPFVSNGIAMLTFEWRGNLVTLPCNYTWRDDEIWATCNGVHPEDYMEEDFIAVGGEVISFNTQTIVGGAALTVKGWHFNGNCINLTLERSNGDTN